MVTEKIETLVVFMEGKKKMKPPGAQAVPFSASGGFRRGGRGPGTRWFQFFLFGFHEYHQCSIFFYDHFRE